MRRVPSFPCCHTGPMSGPAIELDGLGDAMTFVVSTGPANGSVSVDVDAGAFVYTPAENFSGDDSFEVVVTDVNGASTRQLVQVSVNAVADAPGLTVSDVAVQIGGKRIEGTTAADVLHGTAGSDIVVGGEGNDVLHSDSNTTGGGYQVALDVRAALSDLDGSEALAVVISGVPAGASLSAGEEIAPGVWQVAVADLAGLSMTVGDAVDVTLTVSATSRESSGEVATVSATLAVTFEGVDPTQVVDILQGGSGDDTMIGGDGFDYVDFSTAGNGVNVSLRGGTATGDGSDTFTGIEGVIGSDYSDRLVGDRGDNVIIANDGDDRVYSGGGNDTIYDGAGHDKVRAGSGDDVIRLAADGQRDKIDGGRGFDTIDFTGVERAVMLNLDNGNVRGASGNDKVRNIEGVIGGSADDDITGSKGDNALDGGAGNDVIRGGRGADLLTGGEGDDIFVFEVGDVISGRTTYGVDTITDFVAGDQLDFSDFSKGHKGLDLVNDVHLTNTDAGIVVSIDMGGRTGFVDVVLLEGVHDLTIDAMIAGDHFIV